MARLQEVSLAFDAAIKGTLAEVRRHVIDTVHREHRKVMEAEPRPQRFRRWVDGRENATVEEAEAGSVIYIRYDRLDLVVQYAMETLFDLSPVGLPSDRRAGHPNLYRMSHTLMVDGQATRNLSDLKPGQEVVIINPVPYSRKIERGAMRMRLKGTDHVYEQAARIVKQRYGNLAEIRFTYRSAVLPYVGMGGSSGGKKTGPAKRAAAGMERASRVPALVIRERGSGRG
ncbi:MAG: hypothetical protein AB7P16_23505 [Bradyrhizobium sp.]|uniref:hypothetical protein n=1 Tax=Bradyrhizobium sp. TaxID=376 RepID=UPI003D141863